MRIYDVKPRDSLWRIAQQFNVPIQSIIDANGIDKPRDLIVGMDLVIPTEITESYITYTVNSGDTLWTISRRFNVNYLDIVRLNNLRYPYSLNIGQKLQIPIQGISYTVKPGDSLWAIASRFNVPASIIISLNNLKPPYPIFPGQTLIVSIDEDAVVVKPVIETLGYYDPSNVENKTLVIDTLGEYLTYLGIFDFPFIETGDVVGTMDEEILKTAKRESVLAMPVITNLVNGNFSSELGNTVLSNLQKRNNLINNISLLLGRYNLKGVIIDIENLFPEDRDIFTQFISELSEKLHGNNQILILNMPPKWEEWADREWVGFFDYNALGLLIDIAAIMTYEWGWREGPPRATTPLEYVKTSLDYAINNSIPPNKILMGMTLYGYDWTLPDTPKNLAKAITLPEVWNLARRYNARLEFDQDIKQPYMDYVTNDGIAHRVWFVNALSHYYKYGLVKEYGLRGVFYWLLNQPLPATWYIVSNLFSIRKL